MSIKRAFLITGGSDDSREEILSSIRENKSDPYVSLTHEKILSGEDEIAVLFASNAADLGEYKSIDDIMPLVGDNEMNPQQAIGKTLPASGTFRVPEAF